MHCTFSSPGGLVSVVAGSIDTMHEAEEGDNGDATTVCGLNPEAVYPPSPVPSDQRLWPGELPFTAFGHLGPDKLDLRVFDQAAWWVDRAGRPHLLEAMSQEYIENVIAFLLEFAEMYFSDTQRRWFIQTIGDQMLFGAPGADVLAVAGGGPTWGDLDAQTWLESTPLMRALRRRSVEFT